MSRRVQLPHRGPHLQAGVLLLPADHLRALLHARHRLLGQLLARPQRCPRQGLPGRHHPAHHVHTAGQKLNIFLIPNIFFSSFVFLSVPPDPWLPAFILCHSYLFIQSWSQNYSINLQICCMAIIWQLSVQTNDKSLLSKSIQASLFHAIKQSFIDW